MARSASNLLRQGMNPILSALVLALLIGIVACASYISRKKRYHIWRQFADNHDLQFNQNDDQTIVQGILRGYEINLRLSKRSSDGESYGLGTYTMAVSLHSFAPDGLVVRSAQGAVRVLSDALAEDSLQTGAPSFDERFVICGDHNALAYLNQVRRATLVELVEHMNAETVELVGNQVSLHWRSVSDTRASLEVETQRLLDTAIQLDAASRDSSDDKEEKQAV